VSPRGIPSANANAPVLSVYVTVAVALAPGLSVLTDTDALTTLPVVFSSAFADEFQASNLDADGSGNIGLAPPV
tara:strand:- start:7 stop:228 length:222 start_codon:yes stop_codon:yes gene_type:complete